MRGQGWTRGERGLERPHQGIGNRPSAPIRQGPRPVGEGQVHAKERLGGLLRAYYRTAA
jgi:hypothetical protein